jgi:hypothetical protein
MSGRNRPGPRRDMPQPRRGPPSRKPPMAEAAVIRHFQERMPCGLFVPDAN